MKFSLVFDNSGDNIPFDAINPDILEYYVDNLNQCNLNSFRVTDCDYATNLNTKIDNFHADLLANNKWLVELFDRSIPTFNREEYLNQHNLNYLHALWVNLQSNVCNIDSKRKQMRFLGLAEQLHDVYPDDNRFPVLGDVAEKLGLRTKFDNLNRSIHGIESSFSKIQFNCIKWIEIKNIFSKTRINFDVCNFYLPFSHLGRSQYNKFLYFDRSLEHNDENTFDQFLGTVAVSLTTPQTYYYSKEYVEWCKENNRQLSGKSIPLGNISDLITNLTQYRILILRNTSAGNNFSIQI